MIHYAYPGTFSPPTYGHARIAERASEIFPNVTVVCSVNEEKKDTWFSETACKALWSAYALPRNVSVLTLAEFKARIAPRDTIVMIRGIRNDTDFEHERAVMKLNHREFGINMFTYLTAEPEYADISSSAARHAAEGLDLETLAHSVHPLVVSKLLEHVLEIKNIYLAVGKPGSGKSTYLKMLRERNTGTYMIETDRWSDSFKPLLGEKFGKGDLVKLAAERDTEVSTFLKDIWLRKLAEELRKAPRGSDVYVEAAYGLMPGKSLFRFAGGKIIYFGCENESENKRRIVNRGTPEHLVFVDRIPGLSESIRIASEHGLALSRVDTSGSLESLRDKHSCKILNREEEKL